MYLFILKAFSGSDTVYVTTESMFLMAAAKGDRKLHLGKSIDA
jgi:hypothetical protein